MLITAGISIACEIVEFIMQITLFNLSVEILTFIKIVFIEAMYNVIIIIIIYPLIEKAGDVLMRIFKEKQIFTKYY